MSVEAPYPYGGVYENRRHETHGGWPVFRSKYLLAGGKYLSAGGKFLYRHEPVGLVDRWVLADRVVTSSTPDLHSGFYVLAPQGPLPIGESAWKSSSFEEQAITTAVLVRCTPPTWSPEQMA